MSQEIQYLPKKGLDERSIVEAISVAMAPAALGLVKVPESFMKILDTLLKQQMEHPDKSVITAPTKEQTEQAYQAYNDMVKAQAEYEKNAMEGFANISEEIKKLGQKGKDESPLRN